MVAIIIIIIINVHFTELLKEGTVGLVLWNLPELELHFPAFPSVHSSRLARVGPTAHCLRFGRCKHSDSWLLLRALEFRQGLRCGCCSH